MFQLQNEKDLLFDVGTSSTVLTKYKERLTDALWNNRDRLIIIFPEPKNVKGSLLELSVSTGKLFSFYNMILSIVYVVFAHLINFSSLRQ